MDRIQRIEDQLAIRQLVAKYAYLINTFQVDKWTALWRDNGVFDESAVDNGRHVGVQAIRELMSGFCDLVSYQMHFGGAHIIDFNSETEATGIYYTIAKSVTKDGREIELSLYYEDVYVKSCSDWLFQSRKVIPLLPYNISGLNGLGKKN